MNPIIRIHDTFNDTILDREMSELEFVEHNNLMQQIFVRRQKDEAALAARTAALAKLAALGLTTDDLKALGL